MESVQQATGRGGREGAGITTDRATATLAAATFIALLSGCGGSTPDQHQAAATTTPTVTSQPTSTQTATPSAASVALPSPATCPPPAMGSTTSADHLPAPAPPAGSVLATIATPAAPMGIVTGLGSVWVVTHRTTDVYRIDPATNNAVAIAYTTNNPDSGASAVSIGPDGVWVAIMGDNVVDRIDPATNTLVPVAQVPGAAWVTDTPNGLWVAAKTPTATSVSELDPATGTVRRAVAVGDGGSDHAVSMDYAAGSLWVAPKISSSTLVRVDTTTGLASAAITLPNQLAGPIAGGPSAVYAGLVDDTVVRIDPRTNCVSAIASLGTMALRPHTLLPLSVAGDALYVAYASGSLAVLDATTLAVRTTYRLDDQDYDGGATAAFGSLWFATFNKDTVLRLRQ